MGDFPQFMKDARNRIASSSQYTEGIEGYLFDGVGGSQVAFWTCAADQVSQEHAHDFDEYIVVVEGKCIIFAGDRRIELARGDEFMIPRGTVQKMAVVAGTRTIHVFGGERARRQGAADGEIISAGG